MKKNEPQGISHYRELTQIRNILKLIQQLSWDITQFDRRFPFEEVQPDAYPELKKSYLEFGGRCTDISARFKKIRETLLKSTKTDK